MIPNLYELVDNKLRFHFHPGQHVMWESTKRFIVMLAGLQSGKTSSGTVWLWREMQQRGPGDYMIVGPTLRLLERKTIPEFERFFVDLLGLGRYLGAPRYEFRMSEEGSRRVFGTYDPLKPTRVIFGYAENSDSLESATALGIWCDESGQDGFHEDSWDALLGRISLARGRVLHTTTPYNFGWLKKRLYDRWKNSELLHIMKIPYEKEGKLQYYYHEVRDCDDIEVVRFESRLNPAFSEQEWQERKRDLPAWKFGLRYKGLFTRPAGMIYDVFDEATHVCDPFPIPETWERYMGLDFGGRNTAAVYITRRPKTDQYYVYRTYHAGGQTSKGHVESMLRGEVGIPLAFGGAPSEDQWRNEFTASGLLVRRPLFQGIDSVNVGIQRVYTQLVGQKLQVFRNCTELIDEFQSYAYEMKEDGDPDTTRIANKNAYHLLDSVRYITGGWIGAVVRNEDIKSDPIDLFSERGHGDAANPFDPFGAVEIRR
jgi:hypothetical protein